MTQHFSVQDRIFYGLLYWRILRRSSLLKLVSVNESAFEQCARSFAGQETPWENLGRLLYGKRIHLGNKVIPPQSNNVLGGMVLRRNHKYPPPVNNGMGFPLRKEPDAVRLGAPPSKPPDIFKHPPRMLRILPNGKKDGAVGDDWSLDRTRCGRVN